MSKMTGESRATDETNTPTIAESIRQQQAEIVEKHEHLNSISVAEKDTGAIAVILRYSPGEWNHVTGGRTLSVTPERIHDIAEEFGYRVAHSEVGEEDAEVVEYLHLCPSKQDIATLVGRGLSPQDAAIYKMVEVKGVPSEEWVKDTDMTAQEVEERAEVAAKQLREWARTQS